MSICNQILDYTDDNGKELFTDICRNVPNLYKTASIVDAEQSARLTQGEHALIAITKEGSVLKKFPINDAANTWLSCQYFEKTAHRLPVAARTITATQLKLACTIHDVTPTAQVTKLASASVHTNRYNEAKDMQKTASHITTEPVEPDNSKHFYALGNRYPMPDASYVKQASNYFEQYEREFHDAEDRHVFAANVLARAEELSVDLDNKEKLSKYAGEEYGDLLESQLKLRQELLWHKPEMAASLDKLAANKSGTEPLVFAKVLNSFDKHAGLSKYHGRAIADAYQSTFERRFTKTASGYSWEDESTGLTITEKELEKVADEKYSKIKGYFGSSVADQLKKHAVSIFESLPINAKEVIVKIAKGHV